MSVKTASTMSGSHTPVKQHLRHDNRASITCNSRAAILTELAGEEGGGGFLGGGGSRLQKKCYNSDLMKRDHPVCEG